MWQIKQKWGLSYNFIQGKAKWNRASLAWKVLDARGNEPADPFWLQGNLSYLGSRQMRSAVWLRNRDNEVEEEIGKDMVSQLSIAAPQTFRNSTPIFVYNSGSQKIPIGLSRNGLSLLCLLAELTHATMLIWTWERLECPGWPLSHVLGALVLPFHGAAFVPFHLIFLFTWYPS